MHKARLARIKAQGYNRLDHNNLCECGKAATRQVWVKQFTAQGQEHIAILQLCPECFDLMLEIDKGILQTA